jgi:hypothetical protein
VCFPFILKRWQHSSAESLAIWLAFQLLPAMAPNVKTINK